MKISIITATYNSVQYISGVLESIRQQTYPNIELIAIDGCSTDGTVEILKQSNLVSQIVSEKDDGIYDALNKGIQLATGDIIGFLHSDDLLNSANTLQHIADTFSDEKASIAYGDLIFVDQQESNKIVRYWKSHPFKPELLNWGWMPPHPTIFMKREVYEKHGLFNTKLKCAADYDYILRVFCDKTLKIVYLPEVITKMRIGGMSTGGIKNLINKKKEDYWVLRHNNMPFPIWILLAKNFSKIPQLIFRKKSEFHTH
jgi:glycosyltransferase